MISRLVVRSASLALPLSILAACFDGGILEPTLRSSAQPHASVTATPDYSAFDTRAEFNAVGAIDFLNGFEDFSGDIVYVLPTPWTSNGVTYTSMQNFVLGPGAGLGVSSNSLSSEYATAVSGTFADADAFTMFGVDLSYYGTGSEVSALIATNLGSYSISNVSVPAATAGQRFFGISLSKPGEYLKGFCFTFTNPSAALLLDNLAVGHVAAVRNASPVASVGGPYAGLEGSVVVVSLSATDGDGDALAYTWDFGDGSAGTGSSLPANHTYADNGTYEIMLAVDDGRGGVDTARTTATISNVAPKIATLLVSSAPLTLKAGGVSLTVDGSFTDPGALDTHTASLDCGVGVMVQSDAPNGSATGSCTFDNPGMYRVQLTIRDDDGDSDTKQASANVVVVDPNGGWITGGGWINSPVGAYPTASTAAGKLTFDFVARYQGSSETPIGSATIKLNSAKLDFRSTSFDWLMVSDGGARLEGRGTMNGVSDYGFSLTVTDGSGDGFRFRLWKRSTGEVVYDSQPGSALDSGALTPIGGGSIQIH
jgi:hypothetical protein